MFSCNFNHSLNSSYYQLNLAHNSRINTSQNSDKINSFYNETNYNSNFNIDQEMSNLIHKFAEKVGATDDDEQQQQQYQQHQQHQQGHTSHRQGGQRGMESASGTGKYQQRGMEGVGQTKIGGENLGPDQYDLGRDRNDGMDMDDAKDMQQNMGGSGMAAGHGGSGMGSHASNNRGGQNKQFGSERGSQMGFQGESEIAGRGLKHDWDTSDAVKQSGNPLNRRAL